MVLPEFDDECFLIAPIGEDGSPERKRSDDVREFIVQPAAEELGLKVVRADDIGKAGNITLQVIDHVLRAKATVVDLTGRNPNVFYELGLRHATKAPVVLISEDPDLPFDIAPLRTIFFSSKDLPSADRCRKQIVEHDRAPRSGVGRRLCDRRRRPDCVRR